MVISGKADDPAWIIRPGAENAVKLRQKDPITRICSGSMPLPSRDFQRYAFQKLPPSQEKKSWSRNGSADMRHSENEKFLILLLNNKCELIHERIISIGTVNYTCISARDIFRYALSYGAVNIIVVHNHPSGDPNPSQEDFVTTRRLLEASELIGIRMIDHIIIGDNRYTSFKENNILRR